MKSFGHIEVGHRFYSRGALWQKDSPTSAHMVCQTFLMNEPVQPMEDGAPDPAMDRIVDQKMREAGDYLDNLNAVTMPKKDMPMAHDI